MDQTLKLQELLKREGQLDYQIDLCNCPHAYAKLQTELSIVRNKILCCKGRMKFKSQPEDFVLKQNFRVY